VAAVVAAAAVSVGRSVDLYTKCVTDYSITTQLVELFLHGD